ncbi:MAG: nucleotidyltransferase domain-containing protein [Candidatus Njordarchaeia archaeon]
MDKAEVLEKIQKDFHFLKVQKDILGIVVFGSFVSGEFSERSDIDICIIAGPRIENIDELIDFVFERVYNPRYDIKFFEKLPLRLKIEIIKNHEVVFSRDLPELYEYFYFYRKIWKDQERRNTLTKEELKQLLD